MSGGPIRREPVFLVPWPVLMLLGAMVACYAAFALAPVPLQEHVLLHYAIVPAQYGADGDLHGLGLALPFITYMFLHGSLSHLAINSAWLLPFGTVTARRFGAGLFFLYFALCGIAGALAQLAASAGSPVAIVGASGAISGLMGAGFRLPLPEGPMAALAGSSQAPLLPLFSRQVILWSAIWTLTNIGAGVLGLGAGGGTQLIAWQAHLGGYFTGLLLAGPFAALSGLYRAGRTPDIV